MSTKNSNDTIGNRTRDLPACSAVPHATALPRAPPILKGQKNINSTSLLHEHGITIKKQTIVRQHDAAYCTEYQQLHISAVGNLYNTLCCVDELLLV
jgi:hypothetical protein